MCTVHDQHCSKTLYCMYMLCIQCISVRMCCVHACQDFKLSVPISLQSSDEEIEEFAVEIHKKSGSGLGITIAGLVMTDTGGNVQHVHIHIRTVCPQNLAAARFNFEALFYSSDNF